MALGLGSIAFTGFNADGNDDFSFVALEAIVAGTVIYFTDNEWNGLAVGAGGAFNTGESYTVWNAPASGVAAGTVVSFTNFTGGTTAGTGTLAPVSVSGSNNRGIAASGETVYAYLGTSATAPTTFLAAVTNSTFSAADGPLTNTGLAAGATALQLPGSGVDVAVYTGSRSNQTTLAAYSTAINNPANWITQDGAGDQSADGIAPDVPFSTTAFTTAAAVESQVVTFAAASVSVSQNEGNSGTTAFTFTVQRTGGTSGTVSFSGQLASATAGSADFVGAPVLPIAFSGTIPAGSTTATVTVNIAGDTAVEPDELFTLTLQSLSNDAGAAVATVAIGAQATADGTIVNDDAPVSGSFDLSNYVRVGRYDLPEPTRTTPPTGSLLAQEVSAVTYDWDTDTLFVLGDGGTSIVQVTKTGQLINSMTLAPGSSPQGTDFYDPEGLAYVGGGVFVMTEERDRNAVQFTYAPGTTLTRSGAKTVTLGTSVGNVGLEGVTFDPQTGGYIFVKEKTPEGIFQTTIDFKAGTASNGSPSTVNSINLFNPALAGVLDFADVFSLANVTSLTGATGAGNLLVLSQESGKIVEVTRTGNVVSSLTIVSDADNPLSVVDQQHEGVTVGNDGTLYVVSENGGGDIDHPQLWVYQRSAVVNAAPTAVSLSNVTSSLLENASTTVRLKVADVNVTDDGLGTNTLSVTGADASFFEVDNTGLYIKAGTVLDFEAKSSYAVTVVVDDTSVGASPDATTPYTLSLTDVLNENPSAPILFISEVAPWSSGNSPVAADWFEVTNAGTSAISLAGWKMDDNSDSFGSSVALNGITSIAAGESVIFIETASAATVASFQSVWFGANPPPGLHIGTYSGSGVGLSTGGDHVNLFNAGGALQASVAFGAATTAAPFRTFDNAAGSNNTTIAALSAVGVNGAFAAVNSTNEIGSPGRIANPIIPVINEFVFNHVGVDTNEYIEIKAAPNADLSSYRVVVIEGDAASAARGSVISLLTPGIANAGGYWVSAFLNNQLQNGAQTLLLVKDPSGLASGQDLDTNNDGVLDITPWASVVDGVALNTGTAGDLTYLGLAGVPVLTPGFDGGSQTVGGASRLPDGTDTNTSLDWVRNDFDQVGIGSGTPTTNEAVNTPGTPNAYAVAPIAGFQISPTTVTVTEGGATATFSLRLNTAPTANVTIGVTGNADATVSTASLIFTPANYNVAQTVTVTAVDDALVEGLEVTTIVLGNAISADSSYSGLNPADVTATVIDNEKLVATPIHTIQGASHTSALAGQFVRTTGIVTARDTTSGIGFWMQDPNADASDATSEAIFVFSNNAATLPAIGDAVTVDGTVQEFLPGNNAGNLTTTELSGVTVTVQSSGNALPASTLIGAGGRAIPKGAIYNDGPGNINSGFGDFDPVNEGIDFFESLEGMRVQLNNTVVTGATNSFDETWVLADNGAGSTLRTARGGILLGNGDDNPERVQVQFDSGVLPGTGPQAIVNDKLGTVTGVVSYDFGNYQVVLTGAPTVTSGALPQEKTSLVGDATRLTIAEWNVENLDPSDTKFDEIARLFVDNLKKPDVIALQEIQDNNGATDDGTTAATLTAAKLIAAIYAKSGIVYSYADISPANNTSGGEPGGNIRPGYLYNAARVTLVPGSLRTITDTALTPGDAFASSRQPLVADFRFNNQNVTLIDVHSTSKGGSGNLYGPDQPAANGGESQRIAQATEIKAVVDGILTANPTAKLAVLGDFNEFAWNPSQLVLTGGTTSNLFDLASLLPSADRYSYVFDGNTQQLDHTLASSAYRGASTYDIVHIDAEFTDATRVSDHDPSVTRLSLQQLGAPQTPTFIGGPSTATNTFLMSAGTTVTGGAGADLLIGRPGTGTLAGGAGNDLFTFIKGLGGGTITISDFTAADHVSLLGFAANAASDALASKVVAGGGTTILLTDGTHVVFAGVANLTASNFL